MQTTFEIAAELVAMGGSLDTLKNLMSADLGDVTNLIFFQRINAFLNREIAEFGVNLLGRTMAWIGSVAITLMTI